ncbi:MAG: hypothetical protein DID91_2727702452 [Candidatus Nitrotoga sp. MKT]|nr:MAG: hypothetical protein DID91_2727702452 [Candidatus Nitrotoga sp. MKT]
MALNAQNVTPVLMLFVWVVAGAQGTPIDPAQFIQETVRIEPVEM